MEIEFNYEQYDITLKVYCTSPDGDDLEWNIETVYDNDINAFIDFYNLESKIQQIIDQKAEKIASEEACNVALDYNIGLADYFRD